MSALGNNTFTYPTLGVDVLFLPLALSSERLPNGRRIKIEQQYYFNKQYWKKVPDCPCI